MHGAESAIAPRQGPWPPSRSLAEGVRRHLGPEEQRAPRKTTGVCVRGVGGGGGGPFWTVGLCSVRRDEWGV